MAFARLAGHLGVEDFFFYTGSFFFFDETTSVAWKPVSSNDWTASINSPALQVLQPPTCSNMRSYVIVQYRIISQSASA
jgi:hypothetical protein